jgi:lipid-A-disaccharide synthase
VRYFFSTGEASGELSAVLLAQAIRSFDSDARFEGIGGERMRADGWTLWRDHAGWASMGPLAAIPRIPGLLRAMWATAKHIAETQPDLVVLVDFGAFNMRLAKELRTKLGYRGPILNLFPPATWLDKENVARAVSSWMVPVTSFEHQYEFYKSLELPIVYFGHLLASQYVTRPGRAAPSADGGTIALLPGSRAGELKYHVPALLEAFAILKARRPNLRAVIGAANDATERLLKRALKQRKVRDITIERGVHDTLTDADAAFVSSGTAVLETALLGVPAVVLYIITPILVRHAKRVYPPGKFIALPNLVLERGVVPELLQDDATPAALAAAMERVLNDPSIQYSQFAELRRRLGSPNALQECARFSVALAKAGGAI